MKGFTLICFIVLVLIVIGAAVRAAGAQTDRPAAKDEQTLAAKPVRKFEREGAKIVEKIRDDARSKGTNIAYRTGRTFPLMFTPRKPALTNKTPKGDKK